MTDRIVLRNIRAEGRHGVYEHELAAPQPFEVDVELVLDLQPAGLHDELERTVDYGRVDAIVRRIIESTSFQLLEAIAEAIAHEILAEFDVEELGVRVRKPAVKLGGPIDYAGVEIWRRRSPS
jgi:dihydroneopterin aldolase